MRPWRAGLLCLMLLQHPQVRAQQAVTCARALASLDAAIAARDRARVEREGFDIGGLPGCDPDDVRHRRREAARLLATLAEAAAASGVSASEIRQFYFAARRIAAVHAVLQGLAQNAYAERNWAEAARRYADLLLALQNPEPGDPKPSDAEFTSVYQRASETQMLAPIGQVPLRSARDGTPGALDAVLLPNGSRGVEVRARTLPVTFEFDSTVMIADGRLFADNWWQTVRAAVAQTLVLAGHTDPRGPGPRNEVLALDRAAAMARFMREKGFTGALVVIGFGDRCPAQLSAGADYTAEERYQIDRRVEVIADATPGDYCHHAVAKVGTVDRWRP